MTARELNDFGGFDPKPGDRLWKFWPRGKGEKSITRAGSSWIAARELAALRFAELGIVVAAQDLESEAL